MSGEPMLLLLGLLLLCDSVAPCPLVDVTVCDNPYCIGFRTGADAEKRGDVGHVAEKLRKRSCVAESKALASVTL